jgi:hypothetical protein
MRSAIALLLLALVACRGEAPAPAAMLEDTVVQQARHLPAQRPAKVAMTDSGPVMELPDAMRAALNEYAPQFRPYRLQEHDERIHEKARPPRALPLFAVSTDLNSDGVGDLALYGHDGTHDLLFALVSEGDQFRAVQLRRTPLRSETDGVPQVYYLEPAPPGRNGFVLSIEGVAGILYYWQDGGFHEAITGD